MQKKLILLTCLSLACTCVFANGQTPVTNNRSLTFHDQVPLKLNLHGDFNGELSFNQSNLSYPSHNQNRPNLVENRGALLMFRPADKDGKYSYRVEINGFNTLLIGKLEGPPTLTDQPDYINKPKLVYSYQTWSQFIPGRYIHGFPTVKIIRNDGKIAQSNTLDISAPTEQVLLNMEVGMLTPPRHNNTWSQDPAKMGIDFYQKAPLSKLIIAQYLPVYLKSITMPNGTIYKDHSSTTGSVHGGDMREDIAKALLATGIRIANSGINDTAGPSQEPDRKLAFKQTVVQTVMGKYKNGVVMQGKSGGGQLMLESTIGNEFTHEIGHDYGINHYHGGAQAIQSVQAGWGYDAFRDRMLANIIWGKEGNACIPNQPCTKPFQGLYQFNRDAMAGGEMSEGTISVFTQYTPYTASTIQAKLQSIPELDSTSPSGYDIWDSRTKGAPSL